MASMTFPLWGQSWDAINAPRGDRGGVANDTVTIELPESHTCAASSRSVGKEGKRSLQAWKPVVLQRMAPHPPVYINVEVMLSLISCMLQRIHAIDCFKWLHAHVRAQVYGLFSNIQSGKLPQPLWKIVPAPLEIF